MKQQAELRNASYLALVPALVATAEQPAPVSASSEDINTAILSAICDSVQNRKESLNHCRLLKEKALLITDFAHFQQLCIRNLRESYAEDRKASCRLTRCRRTSWQALFRHFAAHHNLSQDIKIEALDRKGNYTCELVEKNKPDHWQQLVQLAQRYKISEAMLLANLQSIEQANAAAIESEQVKEHKQSEEQIEQQSAENVEKNVQHPVAQDIELEKNHEHSPQQHVESSLLIAVTDTEDISQLTPADSHIDITSSTALIHLAQTDEIAALEIVETGLASEIPQTDVAQDQRSAPQQNECDAMRPYSLHTKRRGAYVLSAMNATKGTHSCLAKRHGSNGSKA